MRATTLPRVARRLLAETTSLVVLVSLGVLAVWHLVRTPRSWMLFEDGDSVLLAIMRRSVEGGLPDDFWYSPVLFVQERLLYDATGLLFGLTAQQALAANAVVNVVLFGLAARFAVAPVMRTRSVWLRAASAVLPAALLTVSVLTESSRDRGSFELASLQLLTTYYSATIWAVLVLFGLLLRYALATSVRLRAVLVVLAVAVVSMAVWSNPMVLAWVALPAAVLLALMATTWWRLRADRGAVLRAAVADLAGPFTVVAAAGVVFVLRRSVAFAGVEKLRPDRADQAFATFGSAFADRVATLPGLLEVVLWAAVVAACVVALVVPGVRRTAGPGAVAVIATGALAPLLVVAFGVIGTPWTRYLQPVLFLPLVAVVLAVEALVRARRAARWDSRARRRAVTPGRSRPTLAVLGIAVAVGVPVSAGVAFPDVARASAQADPDVQCVVDWASATDRTGAGDFWTVRGVKYRLADQRQLLQVNATFGATTWLTNKHDYDGVRRASWVVLGGERPGLIAKPVDIVTSIDSVPTVPGAGAPDITRCGTLTIADWGKPVVPIAPPAEVGR